MHESSLPAGLCWEIGLAQQNKHGQILCGDSVVVSHNGDRVQIVLSDGLGSGGEANIASTLTSSVLSGLNAAGLPLEDSVQAVQAVLPVTKRQGLAYATFSLVTTEGRNVHVLQYDSPKGLFLRDGVSLSFPCEERTAAGKTVTDYMLTMKSGDMLVLFSDGVSEAGTGITTYSGWSRAEMEDYLSRSVHPDDTAPRVAAGILSAVQAIELFEFHDDTTAVVLRLRECLHTNLLIGPFDGWEPPPGVLWRFFSRDGKHVLFGKGVTSAAASYLGKEPPTPPADEPAPVFDIGGIDLAVGGEDTFRQLTEMLSRYVQKSMISLRTRRDRDSISLLIDLLAEQPSDVNILFHPADDTLPEENDERTEQVLYLRQLLTEYGKTVTINYC